MEAGIGTALIFTGLGLRASKSQQKLDIAKTKYEEQSANLAFNEMALESTNNFRKALGAQVALAGARGGLGSSDLAQFTSESYANYLNDQATIARKSENARIGAALDVGQARANRSLRDLGLIAGFGKSLTSATNLNKGDASGTKKVKG